MVNEIGPVWIGVLMPPTGVLFFAPWVWYRVLLRKSITMDDWSHQQEENMAAYVIGMLEVRDTSWRTEYGPKTAALIEKHGGRYVARGGAETLEGDGGGLNTFVILEFPSVEHAKAWYNDPEYAPMIKLRQTGSEAHIVVMEGV
jgi:uncharacterized protein (DUF1330 family)